MFLSMLDDRERRYFYSLVQFVAHCDNDFAAQEEEKVQEYLKEMELETMEPLTADLDEVIAFFAKCSDRIKNGVFAEIIVLILSDNRYEYCERTIVDKMAKAFNISDDKRRKYISWSMDMQLLYKQGLDLVEE